MKRNKIIKALKEQCRIKGIRKEFGVKYRKEKMKKKGPKTSS